MSELRIKIEQKIQKIETELIMCENLTCKEYARIVFWLNELNKLLENI